MYENNFTHIRARDTPNQSLDAHTISQRLLFVPL